MRDINNQIKSKPSQIRHISNQLPSHSISTTQKKALSIFDCNQKNNSINHLLMQQLLSGKANTAQRECNNDANSIQNYQEKHFQKGCIINSQTANAQKGHTDVSDSILNSKEMQKSIMKFIGLSQNISIGQCSTAAQNRVQAQAENNEAPEINNYENIESRKRQISQQDRVMTEILSKLQTIQKQSLASQQSTQVNREFNQKLRTDSIQNLKSIKNILLEKSLHHQNQQSLRSGGHLANQQNKMTNKRQNKISKDTNGQFSNSSEVHHASYQNKLKDISEALLSQCDVQSKSQKYCSKDEDFSGKNSICNGLADRQDINLKDIDVTSQNAGCRSEPANYEQHNHLDCNMSSEENKKSSNADNKSAAQNYSEASGNRTSKQNDRVSSSNQKEEKTREEINCQLNMLIAKCQNLESKSDAHKKIMGKVISKIVDSIGLIQNYNSTQNNSNEKEKPSARNNFESPQKSANQSDFNFQSENAADQNLVSGQKRQRLLSQYDKTDKKNNFSNQKFDKYKSQQKEHKMNFLMLPSNNIQQANNKNQNDGNINQKDNQIEAIMNNNKHITSESWAAQVADCINMKSSSSTPKHKPALQKGAQAHHSMNVGEPTATAVTRQTSLEMFDSRFKKMQSSFLLNNSSPLGKFNAQSSHIIENNNNIFRIPQNQNTQSKNGGQKNQKQFTQLANLIQNLQHLDQKRDSKYNHNRQIDSPQGSDNQLSDCQEFNEKSNEVNKQPILTPQVNQSGQQNTNTNEMFSKAQGLKEFVKKLKQTLTQSQMEQLKNHPTFNQLMDLDSPAGNFAANKSILETSKRNNSKGQGEPFSGSYIKQLVLGDQNDQLHRSLSLQSNDYLASITRSLSIQIPSNSAGSRKADIIDSAVNEQKANLMDQQLLSPTNSANKDPVENRQEATQIAINQQKLLKVVKQIIKNQANQQDGQGSSSNQLNLSNHQIQQIINVLKTVGLSEINNLNDQKIKDQTDKYAAFDSIRRTLSSNSHLAGEISDLLQLQAKQNSEVHINSQTLKTPLNQLLSFKESDDKCEAAIGQAQAIGLELADSPRQGLDSFIIKDIDSPSKVKMRLFLNKQKSTSSINDLVKCQMDQQMHIVRPVGPSLEKSTYNQHTMLTAPQGIKNNQELSLLQNIIHDEDDDRFENIKMSDEEVHANNQPIIERESPQNNVNTPPDHKKQGISTKSKAIKKDVKLVGLQANCAVSQLSKSTGQASHRQATSNEDEDQPAAGSQFVTRSSDEKIQDKGEYYLIHRMNAKTKRLNQILQCKQCPMKFPKLCNLRDHVRIHKDDMPFKCSLCNKAFTQAGNRDRHESKRVCVRRKVGNEANSNSNLSPQKEIAEQPWASYRKQNKIAQKNINDQN